MLPLLEILLIPLEVKYALHFDLNKSASMDVCHTVPGPAFNLELILPKRPSDEKRLKKRRKGQRQSPGEKKRSHTSMVA